jgi:hypothetical protein
MTISTPHIGHSRHGLFFTRWIVNSMLNLLKKTKTYPGFKPGTFGLALSKSPIQLTKFTIQLVGEKICAFFLSEHIFSLGNTINYAQKFPAKKTGNFAKNRQFPAIV